MTKDGMISIVNQFTAQIVSNVVCPYAPEITGISIGFQLLFSKQSNVIYATDNSKFPCFVRIAFQQNDTEEEEQKETQ